MAKSIALIIPWSKRIQEGTSPFTLLDAHMPAYGPFARRDSRTSTL